MGADRLSADLAAFVLELLDGLDQRADTRERQSPVGVGHHGGADLVAGEERCSENCYSACGGVGRYQGGTLAPKKSRGPQILKLV